MENNKIVDTPEILSDPLEQTSDLDKMQKLVGNDLVDLSENANKMPLNENDLINKSPDNIVNEEVYKNILEDEANAVVGSE